MWEVVSSVGKPVEAGFQFIWAISFGQLITIGIFILTMIGGAIKLGSIILALRTQSADLGRRMDTLEETMSDRMTELVKDIAAIETETRADVRELRHAITDLNKTLLTMRVIGVDFSKFDGPRDAE